MSAKIQDFGERIEGARKHFAEAYVAQLRAAEGRTLSALWPTADWQQLIDSGVRRSAVGLARAMREQRPPAPRRTAARERWMADTVRWRQAAAAVLSAKPEDQTVARLVEKGREMPDWDTALEGKMVLYSELGHGRALKDCSLRQGTVHVRDPDTGALRTISGWVLRRADRRRPLGVFDCVKEAAESLRADLAENPAGAVGVRRPKFRIREYRAERGVFHIVYKTGKGGFGPRRDGYATLASFPSLAEARAQLKDNYGEWVERLKRLRALPAKHSPPHGERVGPALRASDVSQQQFEEAFGPRGVQFGNYVTGAERQEMLNRTYDALMDLSELLAVRPRQLFFNGRLGLAFGARGSGNRFAHFEHRPANVINLTRAKGAGALAHEWFHALDHEIGHNASSEKGVRMLSEAVRRPGLRTSFLSESQKAAAKVLGWCVRPTAPMTERGRVLDGYRGKPYWSLGREVAARTFESAVVHALAEKGQRSPFLASLGSAEEWADWSRLAGAKTIWPFLHATEQSTYGASILDAAARLTASAHYRNQEAEPHGAAEPGPQP